MRKYFLIAALITIIICGCNSSDSTEPTGNHSTNFDEYDYQLQLDIIQNPFIDGRRTYSYTSMFMRCEGDEPLTNFSCTINDVQCNFEWVVYSISNRRGYNIWSADLAEDSVYTVSIDSDELKKELTVRMPSETIVAWQGDFDAGTDFGLSWTSDLDSQLQNLYLDCHDDTYVNSKEYSYEIDPADRVYTIPANSISSIYTIHEFELHRVNYAADGNYVITARIIDKMSYSCSIC